MLVGALSVATSAYLAAAWLTADAERAGHGEVAEAFRRRALATGAVAGALSLAGLAVLRSDAERVYEGLTSGAGLAFAIASVAAGVATMVLVARRRPAPARWSAAVAVGAIVAGWAAAQEPQILPGLTVEQAAAGDSTLVALLVSMAIGAVILIPSLALLFGLVLRGRFDERPEEPGSLERAARGAAAAAAPATEVPGRHAGVAAVACGAVGVPLTFLSDGGAGLAIGVALLLLALTAAAFFLVPQVALADGDADADG
jgi:cytochrome d ubiquinol oxidase subunit II